MTALRILVPSIQMCDLWEVTLSINLVALGCQAKWPTGGVISFWGVVRSGCDQT